ncbi:YiiX/YebB-like N1pC/P60 family cysteine hydrolase [Salinivibrio sp. VYel4]|uniref:YiiX/YebB-like N1pC/P60 family cysteine hydrolase n=1 Tax=Salinivibrio sp. VYel4 TaxID=2490491 RepID=UPI00128E0E0C|nr:YiiX/YebB-like N1pC/P60 family cysteine hydrolase [Salinivibrio sp. VYel4]MPY01321.1 hypothetical protein [Salinivibrio sp. VYel4]
MKKINIENLKKGDIVLTTSSKKKPSGIIRAVTNSDISHAMICVSFGSVIDSTGEGVQARNTQKIFYEDSCAIHILRSKVPLLDGVIEKITNYARSVTGTRYSIAEAAVSVVPSLKKNSGKKQFCSRMVARAYSEAGIDLVNNPDFCTPNDIKNSSLLFFVDKPSIQVCDEEIQAIEEEGDTTEGMRKVTNALLKDLRNIDPSIEGLNDIDTLIMKKPELDSIISDKLEKSGYLNFWKIELSRFPWRYDPIKMTQLYHSLEDQEMLLDYCRSTIKQNKNGDFKHWYINAVYYHDLYSKFNSKTFLCYANLYFKLASLHESRVKTAEIILSVYRNKSS